METKNELMNAMILKKMISCAVKTPESVNCTLLLNAVRKSNDIEQGVIWDGEMPASSHFGINIMPPPIPTIAPMKPAFIAENEKVCMLSASSDDSLRCCSDELANLSATTRPAIRPFTKNNDPTSIETFKI